MDCTQIEELTAEYLGGELPAARKSAFEAHLENCGACRTTIEELRDTLEQLHNLSSVPIATARQRTRALRVVKRRPILQRLVFAGLKTAAVLALGVYLGRASLSPSPAPQERPTRRVVAAESLAVHPEWIKKAQDFRTAKSPFARRLGLLARASAKQ